jgi:DNA repair protein SbcC/Rad50
VIPQRIQLSGFLSYRAEQTVPFDGAAIWMLSGSNGSGKSAIFDALTYALFGHHRGGSQNAIELINKESKELRVVFDFQLDGHLFRIARTLKRTKSGSASGTQQVFRAIDGGEDWVAVEDTNKKIDFDTWIAERIGLDYETFTSSVLLLQGKAEKLLDSKPSGRAEVLAGIVDLKRYQALHEKANEEKKTLKLQLDSIQAQSKTIPIVTDSEYAAALESIERAESAKQVAVDRLDSLRELTLQAGRWVESERRLAESREKLKKAEYLLGSAVKIERAHSRLLELRGVLPAAHAVVTTRVRLIESERKTERLTAERDAAIQRQSLAEADTKTAKRKRDTIRIEIEKNQKAIEDGNSRLRELSGILKTVELAEEQQAKLADCDRRLAAFSPDPAADKEAAQREVERLRELSRILPVLQRVHDERNDLKTARQRAAIAERKMIDVRATGEAKKERVATIERDSIASRQKRSEADGRAAAAAALARQAAELLEDLGSLRDETSCRTCGQALTPAHFAEEKDRREAELRSAETERDACEAERRAAVERERASIETEEAAKTELDALREEYRIAESERKHAVADEERHLRTLRLAYAELPRAFATRIAPAAPTDWPATRYPERDEISSLTHECVQLEAAEKALRLANDSLERWRQLRADRESAARSLEVMQSRIPAGDLLAMRREYGDRQTGETAMQNAIRAARANLAAVEDEIERHGKEAHDATTARTELVGKLHAEDVTRAHCRETIDRELAKLAPDWRAQAAKAGMNEYYSWKSEHDALVAESVEATYRNLETARGGLAAIREEIREREAESAAYPDRARQHPDQLNMEIVAAKTDMEEREREREMAHRQKTTFDFHRSRRSELGAQENATDLELSRYKTLADLLGRDRLQRHLVRQAERQIVDCANGVLDRLSGGQLFLKLTGADDGAGADRALDLECVNRATGAAPINVMFLSGSQKFRVAVSLALGIGQYASRRHRPIESVIIDEGFGCLDRAGRQTMIQELQNLRSQLHRILLVSHQEEFADAFHDGYRFELVDGATRVTRIQR